MIEARFTYKMKELLKGLKGCELVGISATEFFAGETVHDGKVYLCVGDRIIKISNESKKISWFKHKDLSEIEEIFSFSCEKTFEQGKQKILIQDTIEKVSLITDYITIPQKNYEIALDMAVIIGMGSHKYIISRGWYFGEYLDISVDKNYDDIYSLAQVVEDWNNFGEWKVDIKRVVEEL